MTAVATHAERAAPPRQDEPSPPDVLPGPSGAVDLEAVARSVLATASGTMDSRRAAMTIAGGTTSPFRQTVVALMACQRLDDHACSDLASLQVLHGRVVLAAAGRRTLLGTGEWIVVPPARHAISAVDDAVVLVTTAAAGYRAGRRNAFVP